jgi:hypothetical protein
VTGLAMGSGRFRGTVGTAGSFHDVPFLVGF